MTRTQMIDWLSSRYETEALRWPLLRDKVTKQTYIDANLPHMIRSAYWKARDTRPIDTSAK